jgi:hypothetical protein
MGVTAMTDEHKLIIRTEGTAKTIAYVRVVSNGQSICYAVLLTADKPRPYKFGVVNSMDDFVLVSEHTEMAEAVMRFALATANFCSEA